MPPKLLLLMAFAPLAVVSQVPNLAEERAAVYVSKRQLNFDEAHSKAIAAWVRTDDTLGLTRENLKLAFTIRLGHQLAERLRADLAAEDAFFVNADPALTKAVLAATKAGGFSVATLAEAWPANTRYLVWVDSLQFVLDERRSYYAFSNRIYSRQREVPIAGLTLSLYDVAQGRRVARATVAYDGDNPPPTPLQPLRLAGSTPALQFLDVLFGTALEQVLGQVNR